MKKIKVTIHNGIIKSTAEGYKGGACQKPLQDLTDSLHANILSEEVTAEGCLPDEPLENENTLQQHA